jgi:hypothetical protein
MLTWPTLLTAYPQAPVKPAETFGGIWLIDLWELICPFCRYVAVFVTVQPKEEFAVGFIPTGRHF